MEGKCTFYTKIIERGRIIFIHKFTVYCLYVGHSFIGLSFSFLIFLIYVRGILVIFTYFVALSPNLKTNNLTIYTAPILFIIVLSSNLFYTLPQTSTSYKSIINVFYLKNNIPILLILALILLFTIIVVVKLVNTNKGPLRPFL